MFVWPWQWKHTVLRKDASLLYKAITDSYIIINNLFSLSSLFSYSIIVSIEGYRDYILIYMLQHYKLQHSWSTLGYVSSSLWAIKTLSWHILSSEPLPLGHISCFVTIPGGKSQILIMQEIFLLPWKCFRRGFFTTSHWKLHFFYLIGFSHEIKNISGPFGAYICLPPTWTWSKSWAFLPFKDTRIAMCFSKENTLSFSHAGAMSLLQRFV